MVECKERMGLVDAQTVDMLRITGCMERFTMQ